MMVFFYQGLSLCMENYSYHYQIISIKRKKYLQNIILCWAREFYLKFCDLSYLIN